MLDFIRSILSSPEFASFFVYAIVAIATGLGGAIAYVVRKYVLRKLTVSELQAVMDTARIAVLYIEQTSGGQSLQVAATEKLADAMIAAQRILDGYGITVSATQLRAAIEAAVYAELTHQTLPAPPTPAPGPSIDLPPLTSTTGTPGVAV